MPYDVKRFIFSVSLCAILAVNPVLATAPGETESVGTAHTVYDGTKLNKATNGIAGVGYVNRMVDAAGNAATAAEAHAAAAGAHALSAAQSADEAHRTLSNKLDKSGWSTGVLFANGSGQVGAGKLDGKYIQSASIPWDRMSGLTSWDMISGQMSTSKISGGPENVGLVLTVTATGITDAIAGWGQVGGYGIADGAVNVEKIASDYTRVYKSGSGTGIENIYVPDGYALISASDGGAEWGQISGAGIAPGAVTIDKTAGVVGMVPVGAEGATTYGSFWIE